MAKRDVKLLLMNNNQIILGTFVSETDFNLTLKDTTHLQASEAGKMGLAIHDLNGLVKPRIDFTFNKTSITSVVDDENINDTLKSTYISYASGVQVPDKPQILLKG